MVHSHLFILYFIGLSTMHIPIIYHGMVNAIIFYSSKKKEHNNNPTSGVEISKS